MIFATSQLIYLLILFIFILGIKGTIKEKKALILIFLSIPLAVLLIKGIHLFYFENRPFVTHNLPLIVEEDINASFPSRHATISAIIAFAYTYFKSKWTILFLLGALLIGISRIYVGVHYPLDIIGGFATAFIALVIGLRVKQLLKIGLLKQSA